MTSHFIAGLLPDVGVRLALGASPAEVLRHAMWRSLAPAAAGLAVGVAGTSAVSGLLRGLLFGADVDVSLCVAVALGLSSVALLATWLPARRAASLDPLTVLRSD